MNILAEQNLFIGRGITAIPGNIIEMLLQDLEQSKGAFSNQCTPGKKSGPEINSTEFDFIVNLKQHLTV